MIRVRRAAARELAADFRYYEKDYPGRGRRFVDAVDAVLARIAEAPAQFAILYDPDIRSAKVPRFPYRVVYLVIGADIDVLAVAHAKRRPGLLAAQNQIGLLAPLFDAFRCIEQRRLARANRDKLRTQLLERPTENVGMMSRHMRRRRVGGGW